MKKSVTLLLALATALVGCATYKPFPKAQAEKIEIGMPTSELLHLLGPPNAKSKWGPNQESWNWWYSGDPLFHEFDVIVGDGKVKDVLGGLLNYVKHDSANKPSSISDTARRDLLRERIMSWPLDKVRHPNGGAAQKDAYRKIFAALEKGEFESSAEYQARLAGDFFSKLELFEVAAGALTYDADSDVLEIVVKGFDAAFPTTGWSSSVRQRNYSGGTFAESPFTDFPNQILLWSDVSTSKFQGKNSYGASTAVTQLRGDKYGVVIDRRVLNQYGVPRAKDAELVSDNLTLVQPKSAMSPLADSGVYGLRVTAEEAKSLKLHPEILRLRIAVSLDGTPGVYKSDEFNSPTIQVPFDVQITNHAVGAHLVAIVVYKVGDTKPLGYGLWPDVLARVPCDVIECSSSPSDESEASPRGQHSGTPADAGPSTCWKGSQQTSGVACE